MSVLFRSAAAPQRRYVDPNAIPRPSEASNPNYSYQTDDALKIAAVVACVGMRAGAFAQLPLKAYRDRGGLPEVMGIQPELMRKPSDLVVRSVWKTQMSISRDVYGFAAGLITAVDGAGYPSRVEWLLPGQDIVGTERGSHIEWRMHGETVPADRILHVPSRWVLPGRPLGISPLEHSGLVELAKKAQDFGRDWFRNGAVPAAIVYSDKELTGEQADGIVNTIMTKWRSRRPAVLDNRLEYKQVSVAANESQFIETMRQAASDIAISFNLPPERIAAAMGSKNEYSNINSNQQQYLLDSINPDLVVIQETLEDFTPRGQYLKWVTAAFLQSDTKTQYEMAAIAIDKRFMAPSEVRATILERPPLTPEQLAEFSAPAVPAPMPAPIDTVGGVQQ